LTLTVYLRRSAAHELLRRFGAERSGNSLAISRGRLMARLREAQEHPEWRWERERRQTIRDRVDSLRPTGSGSQVPVTLALRKQMEAVASIGLPSTIRFEPGGLTNRRLHATPQQLCDALGAATELDGVCRRLVQLMLDELQLIEQHRDQLDHEIADLLSQHLDAVHRLAEVPGLGVDSAHQIIAEIGAAAATFPSEKHLASWIGVCPGEEESAGVSASNRSSERQPLHAPPFESGRQCRSQANAAVKVKGSVFEIVFRRLLPRLGFKQAIGAIAHRLSRLIWKILHQGVRYEERGPAVSQKSRAARTTKMIKELKSLGYRVEPLRNSA
jgi:hypothetical protein